MIEIANGEIENVDISIRAYIHKIKIITAPYGRAITVNYQLTIGKTGGIIPLLVTPNGSIQYILSTRCKVDLNKVIR